MQPSRRRCLRLQRPACRADVFLSTDRNTEQEDVCSQSDNRVQHIKRNCEEFLERIHLLPTRPFFFRLLLTSAQFKENDFTFHGKLRAFVEKEGFFLKQLAAAR